MPVPALQIQPSKPDDPAFAVRKLKDVMSSEQLAEMLNFETPGNDLRHLGVDQDLKLEMFSLMGTFE